MPAEIWGGRGRPGVAGDGRGLPGIARDLQEADIHYARDLKRGALALRDFYIKNCPKISQH